ncbi:uncharacterized protein SAPINGB_P001732 [Magnusiomyces paraingens]|uniref:Oxidase FUB9 n=1 Tax=Magnusiomyces paraingens TaxID=2606893 RepID=A0A5E8B759_9ASCO|nr:uncharacterized protein SAPINGB_P001732 [Saprochaete ingens]VVT47480.1 unnamed protein product [Saprochaete ingens]
MTKYQSPPAKIISIKDLERASLPLATKQVREFWAGGASEEFTLAENISVFDEYRIRTKVMTDVSNIDMRPKEIFGKKYSFPIGFAPSGFHQLATEEGEIATAKAAKSHNWLMALSSYSTKSLEEVKQAGGENVAVLQLYVFQNRETTKKLVERAEKAGYKAIALTVDTPVVGMRPADNYNNFKLPSYVKLGNFESRDGAIDNPVSPDSIARKAVLDDSKKEEIKTSNALDPTLTWSSTIPWLRSITKMEIWVKGVATAEDTKDAINAGVDGIWVSNHGGRQLDSTLASLDSLPEVVAAANGKVPIHFDGGIRRASDAFKALALGADFVWVGRPVLYGLLYNGQKGVELMETIFETELANVMMFAGTPNVSGIDKSRIVKKGHRLQKL